MLWTRTLIPTLKETPDEAKTPSHVLMLRSGLVRRATGGAFTYLPLGLRVVRNAERIVRQEMDAAGAVELAMPVASPHHEEIVTDLAARTISSYRQLPITLYQISTKFPEEQRPRFGVLRTSQFLVEEAYSFDRSAEGLEQSYAKMYAVCCRILDRCCLGYLAAEAEGVPGGGDSGHEFMVPAENGRQVVLHCEDCGYAANQERAEVGARDPIAPDVPPEKLKQVTTPGASTVAQVCRFLQCRPDHLIKTLIYTADGKPLAVLIRGDHEANESKIRRAVGAEKLEMAEPDVIERLTGAPVGFSGPVGMKEKVAIWADRDVQRVANAVTGANAADAHLTGVNLGRDFQVDHFADLRNAVHDDPCPRCSSKLALRHAVKVARIFKLGTKYSDPLGANFVDDKERQHPILMGCYRIGINRLLAALVETSHDADGIIWPVALAPYEVLLMPLMAADEQAMNVAGRLHDEFSAAGVEVLLDDRRARPGVKFKDADLLGIPLRVVIGTRGLKQGKLEIKWRWENDPEMIALDGAAETVAELIRKERKDSTRFEKLTGKAT